MNRTIHLRALPGDFSRSAPRPFPRRKACVARGKKADLSIFRPQLKQMNVSGECREKLDEFADETISKAMRSRGHMCDGLPNENEDDSFIPG